MNPYRSQVFKINCQEDEAKVDRWLKEQRGKGYRVLQKWSFETWGPQITHFIVVVVGRRIYDGTTYYDYEAMRRLEDMVCFLRFVCKEISQVLAQEHLVALDRLVSFQLGENPPPTELDSE